MKQAVPPTADRSQVSSTLDAPGPARSTRTTAVSAGPLAQLAAMINHSPRVQSQAQLAAGIQNSPKVQAQTQRAAFMHRGPSMGVRPRQTEADLPVQRSSLSEALPKQPEASTPNHTGLPDRLKSGVESLSGISLDNVKVHYNSVKPAQLNALAYAQGTDIHVAPGQEQHLPHEAWHVVQQAQGRVRPTVQMRSGIPLNDDAGLEHEADVMGAKAAVGIVSAEPENSRSAVNASDPEALQRKVSYKNPPATLIHEVKEALKIKLAAGKKLFSAADQEVIETILTTEFHGKLFGALSRLAYDAADYGEFDLDNSQHLTLLFYEIKKHLESSKAKDDPTKESIKENEQAKKKENERQDYFAKSPNPILTFETAFLGAGAATAYYLVTMGRSIDPYRTLVMGPTQPWAEERGPGVINHPMHMITALREAVGLGDEALAPREDFSAMVEKVINQHVIHRRPDKVANVTKISHQGEMFYQITSESGVKYYARNVVAGLGIGPHITPKGQQELSDKGQARAMNMDDFQRSAGAISGSAVGKITVVISGGNAAIDAVMTSIKCGFNIVWVTGSGRPALLPGTDNEIVEAEYDKAIQNSPSKISRVIQKYAQQAVKNPRAAEEDQKPIIVNTDEGEVPADYFVYAMGPDIGKVKAVFDQGSVLDKLVPTYDENRQFGGEGLSTVVGLQVENPRKDDKTSLEIVGGSAFRMAPDVKYDYMMRQWDRASSAVTDMAALRGMFRGQSKSSGPSETHSKIIAGLEEIYQSASAYRFKTLSEVIRIDSATVADEVPAITAPDFSAVEKISAEVDKNLMVLIRKFLSDVRLVKSFGETLEGYAKSVKDYLTKAKKAKEEGRRLRDPDPRAAATHMSGVVKSLPLNVAVNDQLTPTRSQIEASQSFVPSYVSEDVNFGTDSATVLQIYISVNFPHLEDAQVDEWVDRIIRWRRPSDAERKKYTLLHGPLPNPNNQEREDTRSFGDWFKKRLKEENAKAAEKFKAKS
jgi:Domain of unknown function (DUF4157)